MPKHDPTEDDKKYDEFLREIAAVCNRFSIENRSNTTDFILAEFMAGCLNVYENTVQNRFEHRKRATFDKELDTFLEQNKDRMSPAVLRENIKQFFLA